MRWRSLVALLLLTLAMSGCLGQGRPSGRAALDYPPDWDMEAPERSFLATELFYRLDHSSTFLVKGAQYARYVVKVEEKLPDVQLFFSTGAQYTKARGPDIQDDEYHFEFMQIRPLGRHVQDAATNAATAFSHAQAANTFTLTYIYGNGANYQYLAPYDSRPDHWTFEPGFYEFVIATDEQLTVGINVKTGSDYWSTFYHPQELGEARAEHLEHVVRFYTGAGGQMPRIDEERHALLRAREGETLNYFVFADVMYLTNTAALGADGAAVVTVDGQETMQRMQISSAAPTHSEAYAFAIDFNDAGPARKDVRVQATFQELISVESSMAAILLIFGVALHPQQTLAGLPTAAS